MTFVLAFYSFNLELTNTDAGVYAKWRIKTPRHPDESIEFLNARICALLHVFEDGVSFSHGMFNPDEPAIWKKDAIGQVLVWADVGCPEKKKLQHAIRTSRQQKTSTKISVYLFDQPQIAQVCHQLRGSKTNWVEEVNFFFIPPERLADLVVFQKSSSTWQVTIVDDVFYIVCDGNELQLPIQRLDIWSEFQKSLG